MAIQQDPGNVPAHYYLGEVLRTLAEQEILTEAEKSFQVYLEGGAPLGKRKDVQNFINTLMM